MSFNKQLEIILAFIILLVIITSGCFEQNDSVPLAKADDIQITLSSVNTSENASEIYFQVILENIRHHKIHLKGEIRGILNISNSINVSDNLTSMFMIADKNGKDWAKDYSLVIEGEICFSANQTEELRKYQIQFHLIFSYDGGSEQNEIIVSSKILYHNTTRIIEDIAFLEFWP